MDLDDVFLLPEDFDSMMENNFSESGLNELNWSEIEVELEKNNGLMENLIFGNENVVKNYSILDEETSREILNAFDVKTESGKRQRTI